MSLLELLLGPDNPVSKFTAENRGALSGLGTSLLSSGMNFTPLQTGIAMDQKAAADRKEQKVKAAQNEAFKSWLTRTRPDLAPLMDAGVDQNTLFTQALKKPGDASNPYMSAGGGKFFNWQTGEYVTDPNAADGGGDFETGFTPVWGTYEGKPATVLPGNDGQFYINGKPIDPSKFVPTNPYDLNAQKAGGRAFGAATGGTQFSLPSAKQELDQSIDAISNLQADDIKAGMEDWFKQWGALPRGAWVQGGTNMAKFQNAANNIIDRSWLSARAMLKGAGQVTDYEGTKAENAVSMMKTALEKGDKASYEAAVKDYEYWIRQGFAKIQQQAGAMEGYGGAASSPAGGGEYTVLGVE